MGRMGQMNGREIPHSPAMAGGVGEVNWGLTEFVPPNCCSVGRRGEIRDLKSDFRRDREGEIDHWWADIDLSASMATVLPAAAGACNPDEANCQSGFLVWSSSTAAKVAMAC